MSGTQWPGQEVQQWPRQEAAPKDQGEHGYAPAPPEKPKPPAHWVATTQPTNEGSGSSEDLGLPLPHSPPPSSPPPRIIDPPRSGPRTLDAPSFEFHPFAPPAPGALGRVGTAAKEGWESAPAIPMAPVNSAAGILNPFSTAANTLLGASGALVRGGQQFVQESLDPVSPGLGRDVAAIPEAFPLGPRNGLMPPEPPPPPRYAQPSMLDRLEGAVVRAGPSSAPTAEQQAFTRPAPAPAAATTTAPPAGAWVPMEPGMRYPDMQTRINRDTGKPEVFDPTRGPAPAAPTPQPPAAPPPAAAPPVEGAQPQTASVGAAASREGTPASELALTPKEEAAYRSTAEGNKLLEPQEPGIRDDKQYLPGEKINEVQASQDVVVARELDALRRQTPELDKQMTADETHNNNVRTNAINNALPGQVQINAAKTAREQAMQAAEPKVFGNTTDADVQPIVEQIKDILNDPKNRQNTQLQQYVKPLIDRLVNPDGTAKIVDPRELWSWRQDVQHLTSGAATRADPNLSRVSGMLGKVLDVTDDQLEASATGYKAQLRDDYRNRSRQIDAMEALNAERFKLFDSQNVPNYNAVQRLMRQIVDARQANDPYEPFTHVSQDTLDQLFNIRDSMRRGRAAANLANRSGGSITSQSMGDALRGAARMAVQKGAPVWGAALGQALVPIPGVGPVAGAVAGLGINHLLSERAMAQRLSRGQELMRQNQLMPP